MLLQRWSTGQKSRQKHEADLKSYNKSHFMKRIHQEMFGNKCGSLIRKLLLFTSLSVMVVVLPRCSIFQGQDKNEPDEPNKTAVLWEVRENKAKDPSYIVGIPEPHCFDPLQNGKRFYRALADVDIALVPISKPRERQISNLSNKLTMENDLILDSLLNAKHRQRLRTFLWDTIGINPEDYQKVPPMLLNKIVHRSIPSCSSDKTYLRETLKAAARNINIKLISVFQEQDLINRYTKNISYKKQADVLLETAKNYEAIKTLQEHMRFYYKAKDIQKASKAKRQASPHIKIYENRLVNNVNEQWVEAIVKYLGDQGAMMPIGVEHLGGDNGILQQLRDKGYLVRPYDPDKQRQERIKFQQKQEQKGKQ